MVGYEPGRPGGPANTVAGRFITRGHYEMLADIKSGLSLGEQVRLGRNTFVVVGLTRNQVSSGGDPVAYITLQDAQRLQFELEPPVARREAERGTAPANRDIINAVVVKVATGANPEMVVRSVSRWKHLTGLSQSTQEDILTKSVVDKSRRQIGLFTVVLLAVSSVIISLLIYTMNATSSRTALASSSVQHRLKALLMASVVSAKRFLPSSSPSTWFAAPASVLCPPAIKPL